MKSFILEASKNGKDFIVYDSHKYRESYSLKCGDVVWRCLGKSCKASLKTNKEKTAIYFCNEVHSGTHPVTMRSLAQTPPQRAQRSLSSTPVAVTSPLISTESARSRGLDTLLESSSPAQHSHPVCVTKDVQSENTALRKELAEVREELRVVLDHSIESDQRLLQFTDVLFQPPQSSLSANASTQTDTTDDHSYSAQLRIKELELKLSMLDRPCQSCARLKDEINSLSEVLHRLDKENNKLKMSIPSCSTPASCPVDVFNSSIEGLEGVSGQIEHVSGFTKVRRKKRRNRRCVQPTNINLQGERGCHSEINLNAHKNKSPSVKNSTGWYMLEDGDILSWFKNHLKAPSNTLVVAPSVSHFLKLTQDQSELVKTLEELQVSRFEYVMAAVNNRSEDSGDLGEGDHWSLLVYHQSAKVFYHLDSKAGFNRPHAARLAGALCNGGVSGVMEVKCLQQKFGVECGVHVLHNAEIACSLIHNLLPISDFCHYVQSFSVNKYYDMIQSLDSNVCGDPQLHKSLSKPKDLASVGKNKLLDSVRDDYILDKVVNSNKLVIVGDSHARNMTRWLQPLVPQFSVFTYCYPGAPMLHLLDRLQLVCQSLTSNDCAILIGGTNVTESNYYLRYVVPELTNIIRNCKAKVFLTEIPYIRNVSKIKSAQIKFCNSLWLNISSKYCIPYLIFSHNLNPSHYVSNGSHLNALGKILVCKKIVHWLPISLREISSNFLDLGKKSLNQT